MSCFSQHDTNETWKQHDTTHGHKSCYRTPEDIYTSNHKTTESTSWSGNVRSVIIKSIQSMEYPHIYLTIIKRPIIKIM